MSIHKCIQTFFAHVDTLEKQDKHGNFGYSREFKVWVVVCFCFLFVRKKYTQLSSNFVITINVPSRGSFRTVQYVFWTHFLQYVDIKLSKQRYIFRVTTFYVVHKTMWLPVLSPTIYCLLIHHIRFILTCKGGCDL